jgi:hypothetical protein
MAESKKEDESENRVLTKEEYFKKRKRDDVEFGKDQIITVDYPEPISRYFLVYETPNESIEPLYYWCLHNIKNDLGFAVVEKITDLFAASEHSSFFGTAAQKLGLQQDKVAQFLKISHDIFKGLVLLVRDMRIIDEKLSYYKDSETKGEAGNAAEMALKGQYVELVEGGAKNQLSVLGMGAEAAFAILPDLFFQMRIQPGESDEEFFKKVADLPYSEQSKNVLKQKLMHFYKWKKSTFNELNTRRKFTLNYIRQQYDTIMLYMNWIKPYLKTIKRLSLDMSKLSSENLISAFEGSMVEIEVLARKMPAGNKSYEACALLNYSYRTKPTMGFFAEPYHKGPAHVGELTMTMRSYAWTKKDIEDYKKMREAEDLELLAFADKDIMEAMESMGDELKNYIAESKKTDEEKKKEKEKQEGKEKLPGTMAPFVDIAKGFGEIAGAFFPHKAKGGKGEVVLNEIQKKKEKDAATKDARKSLWLHYKIFKKAHRMITW